MTGARDTVLDYADLLSVTLRDDNIQEFGTRWDEVLLSMSKIPSDDILESLYTLRIRESEQLKTLIELCDMEIHQKISMPNYQKLKTMVKRRKDQKLRLRNFDARNERIETGAVVTSRKGLSGKERGKGTCYQWKAKGQCSRGDQCSFRHESNDRAKPTPKTAPPTEPPTPRGRSASRQRNVRGRSQSGKSNRQPCKHFLKGTCTKFPCEYWDPPGCQFCKTTSGCKFCAECSFPHWKVEEQPNKKPKKGDDKSAVAIVNGVRQLSCVSQDTEPPDSATISRNGTKVFESIRRVRFTRAALRQANIREKEGLSLGKIQVKIPHQRRPHAMKFEDRPEAETDRQERCARGDARRLAKNIYKPKEKDKATFFAFQ